jgi:hypothetical protein
MSRIGINQGLTAEILIARWSGREGGQERANYSLFLTELCDVLEVEHPDPAAASHEFNDYVFERRVERRLVDGTVETGRIDLYKRGHFILEAKQSRWKGAKKATPDGQADLFAEPTHNVHQKLGTLDHLMINARRQAEGYALALLSQKAAVSGIFESIMEANPTEARGQGWVSTERKRLNCVLTAMSMSL